MKLSAIVLTKNEEKNIRACLKSLSFCDEVIVIDDFSIDKTVEVARKMKAYVFNHSLNGDFAAQRNFGQGKARGEWVLFVDADERVTSSLGDEIIQVTNNPIIQYSGFNIKRTDFIWGKELKYGETGKVKLLRLAKRNAGQWSGCVHEEWKIKGKIGELKNPLLHYPHPTLTEFLQNINFYTNLRAKELYMQDIQVYWTSIILYPLGKFFLNYFIKLGFLDGIPGLIQAILMSFHSFLVRAKLWMLWQKK